MTGARSTSNAEWACLMTKGTNIVLETVQLHFCFAVKSVC